LPVSFSRSRIGFTSTTSRDDASPRLRDQLHREVRLTIRKPAANGRADAGRDIGIHRVHIEAHMDETRPGDVRE
jgi:hypothetical protein